MPSQSAPKPPGPHAASGVAGGMRRRPIDVTRKLPLVRSQKELVLDEETSVQAVAVSAIPTLIRFPPSSASQAPVCAGARWRVSPQGGVWAGGGGWPDGFGPGRPRYLARGTTKAPGAVWRNIGARGLAS